MSLVYANKSGTLQCMGGSINLASIVKSFMNPGYAGYVNSLNSLDGNIDLISSDESIIIDKTGGTAIDASGNAIDASGNRVLNLRVAPGAVAGVSSLSGGTGALTFGSTSGALTFDLVGQDIDINTVGLATTADLETTNTAVGVAQATADGAKTTADGAKTTADTALTNANNALSLIPIEEFASAVNSPIVAMTSSYVDIRNITLTTTINSTVILAWGSITIRETGGGGGGGNSATIEYRIGINGVASDTHTAIIPHNGQSVLPVFFQGSGKNPAGDTGIVLSARCVSGTASRTASSLMVLGNPLPA